MKVTRRTLGRMLGATVAAVPLTAGPVEPPQADAGEELRSAQAALKNNAEQVAKVPMPMATEPAFHFKA